MGDSASAVTTAAIKYKPLQSSEIRLVKLKPRQQWRTKVCVELVHRSLRSHPRYLALSYVWGESGPTKAIRVNGQPYGIPQNLHDALTYIAEEFDALASVLPGFKMRPNSEDGSIYAAAYSTVIWLGQHVLVKCQLAAHIAKTVSDVILDQPVQNQLWPGQLVVDGPNTLRWKMDGAGPIGSMPETVLRNFLEEFEDILYADWWWRVWVLQEYVRSQREPIFLPGQFQCSGLIRIHAIILKLPQEVKDLHLLRISALTARIISVLSLVHHRDDFALAGSISLAEQLFRALELKTTCDSTVSHDHIYGLLGMVDVSQLPVEMRPDYEKPFGDVCQEYARLIIEGLGNLDVLSQGSQRLVGNPSWVPDLRDSGCYNNQERLLIQKGFMDILLSGTSLLVDNGALFIVDTSTVPVDVGDEFWALKGSSFLSILRPSAVGNGTFELIGRGRHVAGTVSVGFDGSRIKKAFWEKRTCYPVTLI
ncbi:uncharacterized protein AB675_7071 [Cyphellophora attinorum]|uniref:Heterokaryon incompatibility domain-containing protein n=1 Tax=Cyphellophora attinorum TaxID=1664694 RepID=A0A0N1HDN9_9EURO|nr:uncharacterized protein AB675_7071 [Phialophora attinorum]KPI43176.1 hypothetical protein AB675_7071 [Phialophora attinorum]